MAKKAAGAPAPAVGPSLPPDKAIRLLQGQRDKGQQILDSRPISSADNTAWETVTRDVLTRTFGSASPNVASVMDEGQYRDMFGTGNETTWEQGRAEDMQKRLKIMDALIELLETETGMSSSAAPPATTQPGHGVFVVHGHNEAVTQETARYLERLDISPTILREKPNEGRTIIEKFVDYSDVGFAVVLMTADDRGGVQSAPFEKQRPRARQNVILELGFFLGKLGRKRVCALYQPGVEIPSDYSGVLFVEIDPAGAWKFALAKEMKAANFKIDMNKAV